MEHWFDGDAIHWVEDCKMLTCATNLPFRMEARITLGPGRTDSWCLIWVASRNCPQLKEHPFSKVSFLLGSNPYPMTGYCSDTKLRLLPLKEGNAERLGKLQRPQSIRYGLCSNYIILKFNCSHYPILLPSLFYRCCSLDIV